MFKFTFGYVQILIITNKIAVSMCVQAFRHKFSVCLGRCWEQFLNHCDKFVQFWEKLQTVFQIDCLYFSVFLLHYILSTLLLSVFCIQAILIMQRVLIRVFFKCIFYIYFLSVLLLSMCSSVDCLFFILSYCSFRFHFFLTISQQIWPVTVYFKFSCLLFFLSFYILVGILLTLFVTYMYKHVVTSLLSSKIIFSCHYIC